MKSTGCDYVPPARCSAAKSARWAQATREPYSCSNGRRRHPTVSRQPHPPVCSSGCPITSGEWSFFHRISTAEPPGSQEAGSILTAMLSTGNHPPGLRTSPRSTPIGSSATPPETRCSSPGGATPRTAVPSLRLIFRTPISGSGGSTTPMRNWLAANIAASGSTT